MHRFRSMLVAALALATVFAVTAVGASAQSGTLTLVGDKTKLVTDPATTKVLLTRESDMSLHDAIEMEALAQALLMKSEDFGEFYAAWSEGRDPAWRGR